MRNFETKTYKRIRKDVARKLFQEGRTVYLTPSNVAASDSNVWIKPLPISNKGERSFDATVNEFEYYNCNHELGYYTNFWINKGDTR